MRTRAQNYDKDSLFNTLNSHSDLLTPRHTGAPMLTYMMPVAFWVLTYPGALIGNERKRSESVRSKGDDDEEDDGNSAFCRAAPVLAQRHRPLHHRVNERFPTRSKQGPGPMPRRAELTLSKRTVDGLAVEGKDAVFWDRELAGFGVRVYPSGRKIYVVQSRGPGGSKRIALGRHGELTVEQARKQAVAVIDRIKRGENPVAVPPEPAFTLADLAQRYLETHVAVNCNAHTAGIYRGSLDNHILPALGDDAGRFGRPARGIGAALTNSATPPARRTGRSWCCPRCSRWPRTGGWPLQAATPAALCASTRKACASGS